MHLQYLGIVLVACLVAQHAAVPQGRIVHGNIAANYQFPWHVSLTATILNAPGETYCGASLISPRHLLTAATCIANAINIQANFGSITWSKPLQTQNTSDYVIHPQFNRNFNVNNIAIIRLNEDVWYTNDKRAINLIGQSKSSDSFVGITSYISGFGISQNGASYLSESLRYAFTTVITNELCQQFFPPSYVSGATMCTMGYISSFQAGCYGDEGGALVTNTDGAWYQIGLISTIHGSGCLGTNPNLITKIGPHLPWIKQVTGIVINP